MAKVKIYSTPSCIYCKIAKEFFNKNSVAYEDYNVADDKEKREEMVERTQQMGVPVIDIDGELIIGFDKAKIGKLLNIK